MNKIINGKRYDTDTAKSVASWENTPYVSDFNWYSETLYQKRTGEFFLHGEGNANSKYSRSVGNNSWSGGEKIIPLTLDVAKQWAEKHMDADDYENVFGTVEDENKVVTTLSLSKRSVEILRRKSCEAGISMSEYAEQIINRL